MPENAIQLIAGSDDFLVQRAGKDAWENLSKAAVDEYSTEIIDGAAQNVAETEEAIQRFQAAVQTLPLFGGIKCVWFRNISFLGDNQTGRAEGTKKAVQNLVESLRNLDPECVGVLLTACPVDRRKKAYKELQNLGDSVWLGEEEGGGAAAQLLAEEARRLNLRFRPDGAEALLETIKGNSRLALEETRKIANYLGPDGGEVSPELVAELVPPFGEEGFFQALEAFYSLDLKKALEGIRRHFFAGYDIRPLLTGLQNRNRLLIQLKVLQDAGYLNRGVQKTALAQAANLFAVHFQGSNDKSTFNVFSQNPWYLNRLQQDSRNLSLKRLMDFQLAFMEAFETVLERPQEAESIMRECAVKCLA